MRGKRRRRWLLHDFSRTARQQNNSCNNDSVKDFASSAQCTQPRGLSHSNWSSMILVVHNGFIPLSLDFSAILRLCITEGAAADDSGSFLCQLLSHKRYWIAGFSLTNSQQSQIRTRCVRAATYFSFQSRDDCKRLSLQERAKIHSPE